MLDIEHIEFGDPDAGGQAGAASGGGGTGAGTGASGLGPTGGGGGASGGTGPIGPEDCTNGEDDNGDQLVDCEDPLCTDYQCAAEAPIGWIGPIALHIGTDPNATCAGAWSSQAFSSGYGSLDAPGASCGDCNCGSPSGASCSVAAVDLYDYYDCFPSAEDHTQTAGSPNTCYPIEFASYQYNSARGDVPMASGGSCSPSGGVASVEPATFAQQALGCDGAPSGEGCTAGLCVPIPEAPLSPLLCIVHDGDTNCPSGPYVEKHLTYQAVDDTRGCTDCGCGSPQGVSCGGQTYLYTDHYNNTCAGGPVVVPHDGSTCVNVDWPGSMQFIPGSPSGGSCSESGGQPTGSALPADPLTICCEI